MNKVDEIPRIHTSKQLHSCQMKQYLHYKWQFAENHDDGIKNRYKEE